LNAIILPAARDDILRQFRYYLVEQDKPKVAERFLSAVRRAMVRSDAAGRCAQTSFPGSSPGHEILARQGI